MNTNNTRIAYFDGFIEMLSDIIFNKTPKITKDYFESSSVNCYHYIVDHTMKRWERWIWRLVHIVALATAIWVMWEAGGKAILQPVAISRAPVEASLSKVEFPGVAVCSLNRISRKRATELASFLIQTKSLNYTLEELLYMLPYLGAAYNSDIPNMAQLEALHYILEPYNIKELMGNLTPTCDDIIKRCQWRNRLVNCDEHIYFRKTMMGYCCTFNYVRAADSFSKKFKASKNLTKLMASPGKHRGLSFLIDPQIEDYFYTNFPHEGLRILFFNANEFPDVASGGCFHATFPPKTELYIELRATWTTASEDIKNIPIDKRGCIIIDPDNDIQVSKSDCIIRCRMNSIRSTCKCVPFFLPYTSSDRVCNLLDVACLNLWKVKWNNAWSGELDFSENGEDSDIAREPPCSSCLPTCEETTYIARQNAILLQPESLNSESDLNKIPLKRSLNFTNHSVVHIYFVGDTVVHFEHVILSNWYDLLCNMGGIGGLFLGASIISILEIGYYILGGPVTKSHQRRNMEMRELYWQELRHYRKK